MAKDDNGKQQMVFEEILLREPPPLRIEHARIPIDQVQFDPENPRLRQLKELYPGKSEMELIFEKEPDTNWLVKDIKDNGVLDPIYVRAIGTTGYKCVEGNRRVACVKHLRAAEDSKHDPRWTMIPARILPENTTDKQTALLMASFHVAGKIKWDPHEKAGHIFHMVRTHKVPESEAATVLHMSVPSMKRIIESFSILEDVYKRVDGGKFADKAAGKWSFFDQYLRVKEFRNQYERDADHAAEFARWVGEGRIKRAEDVRELADILVKQEPRHLFLNEPAAEAFDKAKAASDDSNPANVSKLFKELKKVIEICKKAPFADIEMAMKNKSAELLLIEAYQTIGSFMERANVRVPGPRRVA